MSEQDLKPQPGDMVEISLAGEWIDDERGRGIYDPVSGWRYDVPKEAVVKVLEPVDDPSKDPKGTVRQFEPGIPAIRYGRNYWVYFVDGTGYGVAKDATMVNRPVIGVVPGTPAAEAAEQEIPEWEQELLRKVDAERDLAASPWNGEPTARDVCTQDDCPVAPRCSSGATVWHTKTEECGPPPREPRVFPCPGPQPPQGLRVKRERSDLTWFADGGYMHRTDGEGGLSWGAMVPGEYVEVTS